MDMIFWGMTLAVLATTFNFPTSNFQLPTFHIQYVDSDVQTCAQRPADDVYERTRRNQ